VTATGGYFLHKKIADVTTTPMEFPSGLQAHIVVSWLHPFKEQKLVVVGDRKMAVFDDIRPWEDKLLLYPHEITWQDNLPVPVKAEPERLEIPRGEPLKQECLHFLGCIENGGRPTTDGAEGLRVLKVLNAAQKCLDMGCDPSVLDSAGSEKAPESGTLKSEKRSFFAHETAVIDENCEIGAGTKIWHFSHVLSGSRVGENCNIGQNVVIGPDTVIGNRCKIQNNVSVYKGVSLEDGVFCGPSMVFTNIYNPRAEIRKMDQVRPTMVRHGGYPGANCTIVCGVTIGRYAFVGAGGGDNAERARPCTSGRKPGHIE
jgi:UDP-2-acetamido-3-amino-2,3-dideoxy-glucuronate N-acetyltransferase